MRKTPTVKGSYKIYLKYPKQDMRGPSPYKDIYPSGRYHIKDVPHVMYFFEGYAIHGAYWHNNFGRVASHGCVNVPLASAEWLRREVRKGNQQKEGQFGTILLPLSTTARTIYLGEDGYQINYQKYEEPLVRANISSTSPISIEPCFDPLAAVQVLTNLHRQRQYSLK